MKESKTMATASATDTSRRSDAACAAARPGPAPRPGTTCTQAAWAGALFVSTLQRSDEPSATQVRRAAAAAVRSFGVPGCAAEVARAFGDHPDTAVPRMRWALAAVAEAFGGGGGGRPPARHERIGGVAC